MFRFKDILSFGEKKVGPPRARPTPKPHPLTQTDLDILDQRPESGDAPKPLEVVDSGEIYWYGNWEVRSGEIHAAFLYGGTDHVVRITDFLGTLTDLYKLAVKAKAAVIADSEYLVQESARRPCVQFSLEHSNSTITVSQRPQGRRQHV